MCVRASGCRCLPRCPAVPVVGVPKPNLEHQCESLACVASVPASVRCACLGVGRLFASRVCPALGVSSLSCPTLGTCRPVVKSIKCTACGYSCCCACGARAVCSCALGCSPSRVPWLRECGRRQHATSAVVRQFRSVTRCNGSDAGMQPISPTDGVTCAVPGEIVPRRPVVPSPSFGPRNRASQIGRKSVYLGVCR